MIEVTNKFDPVKEELEISARIIPDVVESHSVIYEAFLADLALMKSKDIDLTIILDKSVDPANSGQIIIKFDPKKLKPVQLPAKEVKK